MERQQIRHSDLAAELAPAPHHQMQTSPERMRWRPRLSLLNALLLMTIVGMAIVIVQLWCDVGPLRTEVRTLRNETGQLSIDDPTKLHAMEVRTNESLLWKWRVWIPESATVKFLAQWGNVPREGVPPHGPANDLEPGEQWITMRVMRSPITNVWYAQFETQKWGFGLPIKDKDCWWTWQNDAMMSQGVQHQTGIQRDPNEPLILTRYRTVPSGNSDDLDVNTATAGFIVWLERN